ncbi:unnamed protein product, partial [Pylaiella littoralis]
GLAFRGRWSTSCVPVRGLNTRSVVKKKTEKRKAYGKFWCAVCYPDNGKSVARRDQIACTFVCALARCKLRVNDPPVQGRYAFYSRRGGKCLQRSWLSVGAHFWHQQERWLTVRTLNAPFFVPPFVAIYARVWAYICRF